MPLLPKASGLAKSDRLSYSCAGNEIIKTKATWLNVSTGFWVLSG